MAVDPVVLRGSSPFPWSVVVHGVVYDDDLTLHQPRQDLQAVPPRAVEFSQRPISSRSNPNVSAAFLTLALPPTRTMRTNANLTFLLLPFPLTTPRTC